MRFLERLDEAKSEYEGIKRRMMRMDTGALR
ncbi:Protein of unknown function [Pyronema omphalodes CBS 100304]|uniref:Uncharacterized protein n=1 Tax=Pyronema omphalodes (strain CBS 100304) TaxID=1076935 RepID=U4LC79_PYROM|nr:Protein of unknown function [Pyronema omphalodes CBS 100304]